MFRVFIRRLQDLLVQGFVTGKINGRIGLVVQNGECAVKDLLA